MKSLFEELSGTYTLGEDGMYYPNLTIEDTDQRPFGRWSRMQALFTGIWLKQMRERRP